MYYNINYQVGKGVKTAKASRVNIDKGSEILLKYIFDLWNLVVECIDSINGTKSINIIYFRIYRS